MISVTTVSYGRVKGRARKYPYFQACLYEYRPRKDGVLTARLVGTINVSRRSEKLATQDAMEYAMDNGCLYKENVRQNKTYGDS